MTSLVASASGRLASPRPLARGSSACEQIGFGRSAGYTHQRRHLPAPSTAANCVLGSSSQGIMLSRATGKASATRTSDRLLHYRVEGGDLLLARTGYPHGGFRRVADCVPASNKWPPSGTGGARAPSRRLEGLAGFRYKNCYLWQQGRPPGLTVRSAGAVRTPPGPRASLRISR